MQRSFAAVFAVLALFLMYRAAAVAGPPYETDDPEPTAYRDYEIYLFTEARIEPRSEDAVPLALEVNYGLFPNVQFSVSFGSAYAQNAGSGHIGWGDEEIALKYRFLRETRTRPQLAFYPSFTLATGAQRFDLGPGHGTLLLPLWTQKSSGKWTVFGGGGLLLDSAVPHGHTWIEGVAVTRDVSEKTNVGVEVFHSGSVADVPAYTDLGVGLIHDLGALHGVLFSAAVNVAGVRSYHAYAAYEWRLGPTRR